MGSTIMQAVDISSLTRLVHEYIYSTTTQIKGHLEQLDDSLGQQMRLSSNNLHQNCGETPGLFILNVDLTCKHIRAPGSDQSTRQWHVYRVVSTATGYASAAW